MQQSLLIVSKLCELRGCPYYRIIQSEIPQTCCKLLILPACCKFFFYHDVMYSGEYDVCVTTLSVYPHRTSLKNMPGHGGIRQ